MTGTELEEYLNGGIENIVATVLRSTAKNPRESMFLIKFATSEKKAHRLRAEQESNGTHIPPFLIASITNKCNLHCTGCYARANNSCSDEPARKPLDGGVWGRIFREAAEMGISFVLLAGGEPFVRRDVLEQAAATKNILFPIFTNGTMIDDGCLDLLDKNRNLAPIISIEGGRELTDARRGDGVFEAVENAMERLNKKGILFGFSVTVTKENMADVLSDSFAEKAVACGCKAVIFVEYVPVDSATARLAPDDGDRAYMASRLDILRSRCSDLLMISFPGDEKATGGCLAAGRGFFHIGAYGQAEPCPFSPYSDTNLADVPLKEALNSPLFRKLTESGALFESHDGGCVLFGKAEEVSALLKKD